MTPCYFAPISHWKEIINGNILWELNKNFNKQTLRNRTYIYGPNKILKLSIPIKHSKESFTLENTLIENDFQWQKDHWKSIQSAYKSSPFFEFYEDGLKNLYFNNYNKLSVFNIECIKLVYEWLDISAKSSFTKTFKEKYNTEIDLRDMAEKNFDDKFIVKEYIQVFSPNHGFKNNLSILDLVFNQGPNSISYLK
ncbi:MAG: WbqC family protein [Pelagibacterales bacterium]|nr:WbqC family protein [Pelagibacterales bacterium]